tara:strand:+ start:2431 stop:2985 length:555 start_codon:yes stop_codon:yes gene_type:complete
LGTIGAVIVAVGWIVTALALFVFPQQSPLHRADALVSLSPPRDRLPAAQEALETGLATRLWISYVPADLSAAEDRTRVDRACAPASSDASGTRCFAPLSNDTLGEARAVAELVEQTGVKSVIVTTHTSHSARARFLFEHCLPEGTEVQVLMVEEPGDPVYVLGRMLYETAAFAKAAAEIQLCTR